MESRVRVELHCHTRFSPDSVLGVADVERSARRRGVSVVAITDHGTIAGALEAQQTWHSVRVIVGEEILTTEGEVIGYFLQERIPYGLSVEETIDRIHAQGGIVSVDHPFCRLRTHPLTREALDRVVRSLDCIEVFNARNVFAADDRKAHIFAEQHHLLPIVGSDAHTRWEVGNATIEIPNFHDADGFRTGLAAASFRTRRAPIAVHVLTKFTKWQKKLARRTT